MADKDGKTEKPTPRRIEKSREEGQIPHSQEMLSAVSLIVLIGVIALIGPWFVNWCKEQIIEGFSCDYGLMENSQVFTKFINSKIASVLIIISPILLALMIAGIAGSIMVGGLNFTTKALKWKRDGLNPANGIKQLFSTENLVKLGLSIIKLAFIGIIVWVYIEQKMEEIATMQWMWSDRLLSSISGVIFGAIIRICLGLLVIGAADWFYQKWRYMEKLKMSKQDIKDEHKDTEGSPQVKNKLRQKQFESAMRRMLQDVPKANVVLVNPTHVAVAIQYNPDTMAAPIVLAKGGDHMCEKIKDIARAHGVPIIRRPPLARELYATVKLGYPIPEKLYTAVAEILALIYRLKQNR